MTKLNLTTSNGPSSSSTLVALGPSASVPALPAAYLKRGGEPWGGVSVTIVEEDYQTRFGFGVYKPVQRAQFVLLGSSAGNRMILPTNDVTFTAARWIGGRADVYRLVNGDLTLVRSSEIVAGNFASAFPLIPRDHVVEGTSFEVELQPWEKPGHEFWFGVAARGADGRIGLISYASHNSGSMTGTVTRTASVDVGNDYLTGGALAAPSNLTVQAHSSGPRAVSMSWSAVASAVGYVPFKTYVNPATLAELPYLDLANDGGGAVQAGDYVLLVHELSQPSPEMFSPRVWNARTEFIKIDTTFVNLLKGEVAGVNSYEYREFEGSPPAPGIAEYGRITLAASSPAVEIYGAFYHSRPEEPFYRTLVVGATYTIRFWAKSSAPITVTLVFGMEGIANPDSFTVSGSEWTEYSRSVVFTQQRTSAGIGRWSFQIRNTIGSPADFDVAGFRMEDDTKPFGRMADPMFSEAPPNAIARDHNIIKDAVRPHRLRQVFGSAGNGPRGRTMQTFLEACRDAGMRPWIQTEWYWTAEEWADIMAFLGAPVSSGHWAALLRASMGQTAPWTDVFDRILFEFGNEAWNGIAEFWTTPSLVDAVTLQTATTGTVYGLIARRGALAMMGSPYWSNKLEWVLGGWSRNRFGADAAQAFALPCYVGIANYNGGWDEGTALTQENAGSYAAVVSSVPVTLGAAIDDLVARLQAVAAEEGSPFRYGDNLRPICYEAGPGYQLSGLNGATVTAAQQVQQEVVMKSKAAATATAETFLYQASRGFALGNFFVYGDRGDYWQAYAPASSGGGKFPTWRMLEILQREVGNDAHAVDMLPMADATNEVIARDGSPVQVPTTWAYGVTRGRRMAIVVGNRDLAAARKPTILTAIASATSARAYYLGGDYRHHNRYPVGTRPATAIQVKGADQTGGTLLADGFSFVPLLGQSFTIAGNAQSYTVQTVTEVTSTEYSLGISPNLAATPADNAAIAWSTVTDGSHADPFCVEINVTGQTISVPSDPSRLVIDDALGATSNGIEPGCMIIIILEGVRMQGLHNARSGRIKGGDLSTADGRRVHTFTANGSLTVSNRPTWVEAVITPAGASGQTHKMTLAPGVYPVTVGTAGGASSFNGVSVPGGGGGGSGSVVVSYVP